ncbi:hypothetical protein [Methylobacterium sp. SD21]|uniref:hypothetical protein n=1 Tax=Methylobacterium litchii TaxID=3138810 RepID=UPI00313E2562
MANEPPRTVGRLREEGVISNDEVTAAVEAYLADPKGPPFEFASGHVLYVARAVHAYRQAREAMAVRGVTEVYRRTIVRTAVILATPTDK